MHNSENFSAPTKATSGRPTYSPALYQIQSEIAKLLVSFRCQVKIREGQAGETAWCYGLQSVMIADVWWTWWWTWWCRSGTGIGYLKEFYFQSSVECSRGVRSKTNASTRDQPLQRTIYTYNCLF